MARRPRGLTRMVSVAAALIVVASACSSPAERTAPSLRSSASPSTGRALDAAALGKAISHFLETSTSPGMDNVRAVLVWVDDRPVVQQYRHSKASDSRNIASVTKSMVSTLIGIALAEGQLKGLDQTLGELLPTHEAEMAPKVKAITLRQLLTMTAGLPEDDDGNVTFPDEKNWVRGVLTHGTDRPPPAQFAYSSLGSHLLAAILVQNTGRPLLAYAREKLFDPLGIDTRAAAQPPFTAAGLPVYEAAHFAWPVDPQGINIGYGYLKMTPADMAKLGRLYLAGGVWNGRRIVSADWVHQATRPQVQTHGSGPTESYGYQWWVTSVQDHPAFAALGFGGQLVEVVPDLKLVVAASTDIPDNAVFNDSILFAMVSLVVVPAVT